jgi:pimeloyl-ACP methyl ester carboxylesterase
MTNRLFTLLSCLSLAFLVACDNDNSSGNSVPPEPEPPITEPVPATLEQETIDLPSAARPAHTPGSPGVVVDNPRLIAQFGGDDFSLNNARYTRYFLSDQAGAQPDVILVLVPGFIAGGAFFSRLAEILVRKAKAENSLVLEVWAVDRRANQLEDTVGLELAVDLGDPDVGLNFLFGEQLGLPLSEPLVSGPNRRGVFYNNDSDTAFLAQWTPLVHSRDIDVIVERARERASNSNVFLGGHSAGTGFTARYAATDFNFSGGEADPGYRKVRGLILMEGGGAANADTPTDEATLDLIEARFDGGLFAAVRDQAPRCSDGLTACTVENQALDCAALRNTQCVEPTPAYADVAGLLPPQVSAASVLASLDGSLNEDGVLSILQQEQNGEPGNTAIDKVPELEIVKSLLGDAPSSSRFLVGQFLDDDGLVASIARFFGTSLGFAGPVVDGIRTWASGPDSPPEAFGDNGPAPESLEDVGRWGLEVEPVDLLTTTLPQNITGQTNLTEWYYPSSGLGVVAELGLDTSALSLPPPLGRGRTDIDNRTQGASIDIPVIAFGGSNGLTPTPASWLGFARAIAPCAAPACDGVTGRLVDEQNPNPAFPTYGEISGGFEVYIAEGYAHSDVAAAEDDETNNVIAPLLAFMVRHLQ